MGVQPAEDYLAWPPRVAKEGMFLTHSSFSIADYTSKLALSIFRTKPGRDDIISYYDFERSVWISIHQSTNIPILKGRPVLIRDFTLQDDQCLGWEAIVEAAGYNVMRPIRKGQQLEETASKFESVYQPYSRPTKKRCRVSPSGSPTTEPLDASRDNQDRQGGSRGRHGWWTTMSASEVIEGLTEMESLRVEDGAMTLQQRFYKAFPGSNLPSLQSSE